MLKRASSLCWLALPPLLSAAPAVAIDVPAASAIDAVTVYPRGADVVRLGEVSIPAGDHRVILSDLPQYLNADSLRVRFGSAAVIVGAVEAAPAYPESGGPERAQALRDRLQDIQDQIQAVDDRIATAELQVAFLASQASPAKAGSSEGFEPGAWAAALTAIEEGSLEARRVMLAARQERRVLEREAQEIQLELNDFQDDLAMRTEVAVALTAEQAVTTELVLEYQVADAGWGALYDARLDSEAASLALERKINVFQNTGEDWSRVSLSVSTAPPTDRLEAPAVRPQYLTLEPPPPPAPPAPVAAAPAGRSLAFDEADSVAVTGSRRQDVETVNASFASAYTVGGRVDVLSDGRPRTFTIGEEDIAVDLVIRTAPRLSLDAFVTAKIIYEGDGPLPDGALRLYRDGAYLRESRLGALTPGDEMELGFGIDQSVVVTWVDEGGRESEVGMMGRNTEVEVDDRFTATNRHTQPFTIEIVDRLPISQDDDIAVRMSDETTPPDDDSFNDMPGVVAWRAELAPEESLSVRSAYTIVYPSNERLRRR